MQIIFWNFRLYGLIYTIFVNLSPSKEKKSIKICVYEDFVVILQRETMDSNHSSAGMCIFWRMGGGSEGGEGGGSEGGEDGWAEPGGEGGWAEPGGKGGEEAE